MIPLYIAGREAPPGIVSYKIKKADIDSENSGRNCEDGIAVREVLRKGVVSIDVEFQNLTSQELEDICKRISPDFFDVKYFDGKWNETSMYAGDRDTAMFAIGNQQYWSLSVSFVEK